MNPAHKLLWLVVLAVEVLDAVFRVGVVAPRVGALKVRWGDGVAWAAVAVPVAAPDLGKNIKSIEENTGTYIFVLQGASFF